MGECLSLFLSLSLQCLNLEDLLRKEREGEEKSTTTVESQSPSYHVKRD